MEQVVLKIGSTSKLVFGRQEWSREIRVVERHWWETSWGRSSSSRSSSSRSRSSSSRRRGRRVLEERGVEAQLVDQS